jgi:hypothetical protein
MHGDRPDHGDEYMLTTGINIIVLACQGFCVIDRYPDVNRMRLLVSGDAFDCCWH